MKIIIHIFFAIFLLSSRVYALDMHQAQLIDNTELAKLYEADQSERLGIFRAEQAKREAVAKIVWQNDVLRAGKVKQFLNLGQIRTAVDYWHAAFIMQHGESSEDIKLAFSLGTIATELAPEIKKYKWITAASWDRILIKHGQPQWYGTQFILDQKTGLQAQDKIAEGAVTDEEREFLGVPTLKESVEMLEQINAGSTK